MLLMQASVQAGIKQAILCNKGFDIQNHPHTHGFGIEWGIDGF